MRGDEEEVLIRDDSGLLHGGEVTETVGRKQKWCTKLTKTLCLSMGFFVLGLLIALPGPTLLDLGSRLNASTSEMMLVFVSRSGGYLAGGILGGILFDCFDKQLLLFCTLLTSSVATVVIPWSLTLAVMATMFGLQGITMGVLDTGGNIFCLRIWGKKSGPYMQTLHFAYGIGAFVAPLLAKPFLSPANTTELLQGNIPVSPHLTQHLHPNRSVRSDHFYLNTHDSLLDTTHLLEGLNFQAYNKPLLRRREDSSSDISSVSPVSSTLSTTTGIPLGGSANISGVTAEETSSPPSAVKGNISTGNDSAIGKPVPTDDGGTAQNNDKHTESGDNMPNENEEVHDDETKKGEVPPKPSKPSAATDKKLDADFADGSKIKAATQKKQEPPLPGAGSQPVVDGATGDSGSTGNHSTTAGPTLLRPTKETIQTIISEGSQGNKTGDDGNGTVTNATVHGQQSTKDGNNMTNTSTTAKVPSTSAVPSVSVLSVKPTQQPTTATPVTTTFKPAATTTLKPTTTTPKPTTTTTKPTTTTTKPTTTTSTKPTTTTTKPTTTTPKPTTTTPKPTTTTPKPTTTTPKPTSTILAKLKNKITTPTTTTLVTTITPKPPTTTTRPGTLSPSSATKTNAPDIPKGGEHAGSDIEEHGQDAGEVTKETTVSTTSEKNITITPTAADVNTSTDATVLPTKQVTIQPSTKPTTTVDKFLKKLSSVVGNISRIQFAYLIVGLALFINALIFLVMYCKDKGSMSHLSELEMYDYSRNEGYCFKFILVCLLGTFFFCYVGMEVTYGALVTTFTVKNNNWPKAQGAIVASIFWGSLAAGRGFSVFIARCCGPTLMLVIDLVLMCAGGLVLSVGIYFYQKLLWLGTLILGLGMSSAFPAGITWAENYFRLTGKSTAVLVIGSALGQMVVPVVTGYLFDHQDSMVLMHVTLALSIVSFVIFISMHCVASRKGNRSIRHDRNGFLPLEDDDDEEEEENVELDLLGSDYSNTRLRKDKRGGGSAEYRTLVSDLEDD